MQQTKSLLEESKKENTTLDNCKARDRTRIESNISQSVYRNNTTVKKRNSLGKQQLLQKTIQIKSNMMRSRGYLNVKLKTGIKTSNLKA